MTQYLKTQIIQNFTIKCVSEPLDKFLLILLYV